MPSKSHKLLNALLYQVGWFSCMLIAEPLCGLIATVLMLTLHFASAKERVKEFAFIGVASALGYGMDLAVAKMGYIDLRVMTSHTSYLVLLWILFSTTLRSSMSVILTKKTWALLLGLAAPWAYWVGQNLGRVHYTEPFVYSMVLHALSWSLLMYLFYKFNNKLFAS